MMGSKSRKIGIAHALIGRSLEDLADYMGVDRQWAQIAEDKGAKSVATEAWERTHFIAYPGIVYSPAEIADLEEEARAMGWHVEENAAPSHAEQRAWLDVARFAVAVNAYARTVPLSPDLGEAVLEFEFTEDGGPESGPHLSVSLNAVYRTVAVA